MVLLDDPVLIPHHRKNRRRERPGARKRRSLARKEVLDTDYREGLSIARDLSIVLPFDAPKPSPLLRQNFDLNWRRWKAREAEEKSKAEIQRQEELADQQHRLFGGEVGDDVLRAMGILYDDPDEDDVTLDSSSIVQELPPREYVPSFRASVSRRPRRTSRRLLLPVMMEASLLSDDPEIARLIAASQSASTLYSDNATSFHDISNFTSPQSLPPSQPDPDSYTIPLSSPAIFPTTPNDEGSLYANWTIIDSAPSTPASEPETWEILGDDL